MLKFTRGRARGGAEHTGRTRTAPALPWSRCGDAHLLGHVHGRYSAQGLGALLQRREDGLRVYIQLLRVLLSERRAHIAPVIVEHRFEILLRGDKQLRPIPLPISLPSPLLLRGRCADQVEQRAEDAERTKDEAARRRAMEERLRIARELHDSLTHSISVIQVQAGVAKEYRQ